MPPTELEVTIVCKASAIAGRPPRGAIIEITGDLPDGTRWPLERWDALLDEQAQSIERILRRNLPGGTYDRLLCRMIAAKASHFAVAHESDDAGT